MKLHRLLFALAVVALYAPHSFAAPKSAKCKTQDLVTCMDSACLTDLATDPGSRCVLCGSEQASKIANSKKDTYAGAENAPKFQALSLGASSKLIISDKDLKGAPKAPDERYAWAINQCLKKVSNCEAEDARDEYDPLIEKSCKAFMSAEEYLAATSKAVVEKSSEVCRTEIGICMTNELRCGAGWTNCKGDLIEIAAFDKFYSSCLIETGCTDNGGAILAWAKEQSKAIDEAIDKRLATAKSDAAAARKARWNAMVEVCKDNVAKNQCIESYCAMFDTALGMHGTPIKAILSKSASCMYVASRQMAESICGYVDEVCAVYKQANFDFGD